jgi:hypothetical protein
MIFGRRSRPVELVDAEGEHHRIPLPPHAVPGGRGEEANVRYTSATVAEIREYFDRTLSDAGWTQTEVTQLPSGVLSMFRRDDKRLRVLLQSQTGIGRPPGPLKLTFTITTNVRPSQLEQDLAVIGELRAAGDGEAAERLISLLDDPRARIRRDAAAALAAIKDERSVPPLLELLEDDDIRVRQRAAFALGELGDQRAAGALLAGINDDDQGLAAACAYALGKLREERAVTALIAALDRPYVQLRMQAALSLGEIGDRSAVDPLIALLKDANSDQQVRLAAVISLKELLPPVEFSALLETLPAPARKDAFSDGLAEDIAEFSTGVLFDFLGVEH